MPAKPLGAHVPWGQVDQHLSMVLDLGLAPEIAFKGPELDSLSPAQLQRVATAIRAAELRPTVHAPFFDLNPGALDPLVQKITYQRLEQALNAAGRLNAHLMVVHPGFDRWRYPGLGAAWIAQACTFFPPLLQRAEELDCRIALENIYEETPESLTGLVDAVDSPWFGHCFDVGHWFLFGRQALPQWLEQIGSRLFHLHLHDNRGEADDHAPVGEGCIDFPQLFSQLHQLAATPSYTLEAHSPADLERSLAVVTSRFLTPPA